MWITPLLLSHLERRFLPIDSSSIPTISLTTFYDKIFDIIQVNAGWRIWSFIRISAGDQVGWSELSDSNTCNESTVAFLRSISNLVIGSDVDKYSTLITRLRRRFVQNLGFSSLKPLAGVENALIDLFCKLNKLSAISLLRGIDSGSFDVYWSHFGTTRVRASDVCSLQRLASINDITPVIENCLTLGINTVKSNQLDLQLRF